MAVRRKMLRSFDLRRIGDTSEWVVGVDEAGRGSLAGPVVAGAMLLHKSVYHGRWCKANARYVDDSKKLSIARREGLYDSLKELCAEGLAYYAAGFSDAREVDSFNVLGATRLAMQRALLSVAAQGAGWVRLPQKGVGEGLFAAEAPSLPKALVLVDGKPLVPFPFEHEAIVKGDGKSLVIALASIVAKVRRDRHMCELAEQFPQYGFVQHKGYGTERHREAILSNGPCQLHRASFLVKIMEAANGEHDNQVGFDF